MTNVESMTHLEQFQLAEKPNAAPLTASIEDNSVRLRSTLTAPYFSQRWKFRAQQMKLGGFSSVK
jgi:hypothetical protein